MVDQQIRYELLDKDGNRASLHYTAFDAAQEAARRWPDQEQDEERSGRGWDIAVVGADRSLLAIETREDGIS